jgi:5-methylcytosine-specific restriction enzyme subunit McrC
MQEWQRRDPKQDRSLSGFTFGDDQPARRMADQLTRQGRLDILELVDGLRIESNSYVGRVELGLLQVIIQPKLTGLPLLNLLRYAYKLRNLDLLTTAEQVVGDSTFQDLLIHQLEAEAQELLSRGLHRNYRSVSDSLAIPRGRLDFQRYVQQGGTAVAALPCTYHPRLQNTLVNQALLSGLQWAARLTADLMLRTRLRRLTRLMADDVESIKLDYRTMAAAWQAMDRRTATYEPALTLIGLLLESAGVLLEEETAEARLPGFLFDMNRFFQALLSRFLHENLVGFTVQDEYQLKRMMAYVPGYELRNSRPPMPRPDFAVLDKAKVKVILDAKYVDIGNRGVSRDILYQLTIYALSQKENAQATVLYPTLTPGVKEARIEVRDPVQGIRQAQVILRPVNLLELERLIATEYKPAPARTSEQLAHYLAFGG